MVPRSRAALEKILAMVALLLPLGAALTWTAEKEKTPVDRGGDPLPAGVVARLVSNKRPGEVLSLAFSPDGRLLASYSPGDTDKGIHLWDVQTAKEVRALSEPTARVRSLAFAPDGKALAAYNAGGGLVLWDVDAGKVIFHKRSPALSSRWDWIRPVAFSPDGKTVASLAGRGTPDYGFPDTVHLWESITGDERIQIASGDRGAVITSFAFSSRGLLLAIGTASDQIHLWNLAQERFVRTLMFDGQVNTVAFSPDGSQLFAVGYADPDQNGKLGAPLRSWDVAGGKPLLRLTGEDPNKHCLALSPNGKFVAIARGKQAILLDSTTGQKRAEFAARARLGINTLAFSPDGKLLATADKEILLWDLSSLPPAKGADRVEKSLAVRPQPEADAKDWPREEVERFWADLAGDAATAYRAIWSLARHSRQSLPLLRERLQPLRAAKPERVAELLDDLDSDTFVERQKATRELEKLDDTVETALRKALAEKPSLEKRLRIERLLGDPQHPPAEQLRVLRALEVLEHLGTPEARRILQRLGEGTPEARRTREAKASLERLNRSSTVKP